MMRHPPALDAGAVHDEDALADRQSTIIPHQQELECRVRPSETSCNGSLLDFCMDKQLTRENPLVSGFSTLSCSTVGQE